MSVSLLINQHNNTDATRIVPIATESIFSEFWKPAASQLNLRFVPLFQTGLPIRKEDLFIIVEELRRLKLYFIEQKQAKSESNVFEHIIGRVDILIGELQQFADQSSGDIYIG